jgi:arabinogalactan oligomer / maltooligosaccharide transport system substrate-binding protein
MKKHWFIISLFVLGFFAGFIIKARNTNASQTQTDPIEKIQYAGVFGKDGLKNAGLGLDEEIYFPIVASANETLLIWTNSALAPVLTGLADDFMATYQVELVVEEVSGISELFLQNAPNGTGPDIAYIPHDDLGILTAEGLITPLDLGTNTAQFMDAAIEGGTMDGALYGLPFAIENLAFFYNPTLVPSPPATWDEVQTIGESLQTNGDVLYGMSLGGGTYDAYPLMTAFGGYVFGKDVNGNWDVNDLGIDSPGMISAVAWLADRAADGFISSNLDWDTAHTFFETGESPFLMTGPWALDRIRASGVPYAITDIPDNVQPGSPFASVQLFIINSYSSKIAIAKTFLTEFVMTEETMIALSEAGERPPAYLPALENISDADIQVFGSVGENAQPVPNIPEMGFVWGPWNNAVYITLQGEQTAEEALTGAANIIRDFISSNLNGMVNVPGSYQTLAGCLYDWDPTCPETAMTDMGDGTWMSTFSLPAGVYECKVALNGSWTVNYGVGGVLDGDNYIFSLEENGTIVFLWDEGTKLLSIDTQ